MVENKHFLFPYVVCIPMSAGNVKADSHTGITAITRPNADATLSFVQPGRIAIVFVKDGKLVEAGQVLAQQDDAARRVQLAQPEVNSKNTTNIEAGKTLLAQKRVDFQKIEIATARNAATELEVEHTKLDAKMAGLLLEVAIFEQEQAVRKYEEAKII